MKIGYPGPHIDAFEQEICEYIGGDVYAAASTQAQQLYT